MAKCVWCGRRKKLFEAFNKYGFCPECKAEVREDIEYKISGVEQFISSYNSKSIRVPDGELGKLLENHLSTLDELEELRKKVPMFKSSTEHLRLGLLSMKQQLKEREQAAETTLAPAQPMHLRDAGTSPSICEDKQNVPSPDVVSHNTTIIDKPKTLTVPQKIDNFELAYLYRDVFVVGIHHADPDFQVLGLCDHVDLVPDPDNEVDKKAVKVMCNGQRLGFIASKRETLQRMVHQWTKKGQPIFSAITFIDEDEKKINIVIGFYQDEQEILDGCETIYTKLVKTLKKDELGDSRQDNIGILSVGDSLDADYDWKTETYIVTGHDGIEMGELSKSVSSRLQEEEDNYYPYIVVEDISLNNDLKYIVKIKIYLKTRVV